LNVITPLKCQYKKLFRNVSNKFNHPFDIQN